jgi:hypothetical protein
MFSHLLADAWQAILSGQLEEASFLLWPLFPAPTYPKDSLLDHLTAWVVEIQTLRLSPSALLTSEFGIQFVLLLVLFGVWAVDGFPGVRTTWQLISRVRIDTSRTPDR